MFTSWDGQWYLTSRSTDICGSDVVRPGAPPNTDTSVDGAVAFLPLYPPLGFLAFLGYLWWRTGEAGYWFKANHAYWHDRIGW